ncbi:MAG: hypothetical protein ABR592_12425 [Nitriliruptorales bacterium]
MLGPADAESSGAVAARVLAARANSTERWGTDVTVADAPLERLRATCSSAALGALGRAVDLLGLSARGFDRCLRVARTLADLEGASTVDSGHVDEALAYRLPPARAWLSA